MKTRFKLIFNFQHSKLNTTNVSTFLISIATFVDINLTKGRNGIIYEKKIIVTGIILFCLVSLIVFLCVKNINKSNEQSSNSNNFKIVTSFYPMYIIAENLTQNAQNIELSNMAEVNGGCLHDYTLSTNDVKKFENADVFIENGVGIENFTEKLLQVYSNLKVIDSSTGITDIINDEEEENGHIWTSMENYKKQVKT